MKYIELEIGIKPEHVESLLNELSIAGINDAVINNPVEIADIVSNLGDTEWYDAEQVADDFIVNTTFDESHNCDAKESSCANDATTLATVLLYCTDDEEGHERAELIKRIVARSGETFASGTVPNVKEFASGTVPNVKITETLRDDSEWKDAWKEYYHTARVSERFIVKPSWEEISSDLNDIPVAPGLAGFAQQKEQDCADAGEIGELGEGKLLVIEIDPGMAFGTGTHETTSLSLRLMEKYIEPGDKVLDVGTGSGILAIAAAKLGASDVLGIDIDEDAVRVANENIQNNLASGTVPDVKEFASETVPDVKAVVGDLTEGIDYKADVVVANLLADLVMKLTGSVARHMKDDAVYITSGILIDKQEQVVACLSENDFRIIEILDDGEWCAIAANKKEE